MASRMVEASPTDLTAPAPPRNLNVVKMKDGIKLLWERGAEKDIVGYNIYRRLATDKKFALIGKVKASQLFFIDRQSPAGEDLYYAVTAVDAADPPNESKFSKEIHNIAGF